MPIVEEITDSGRLVRLRPVGGGRNKKRRNKKKNNKNKQIVRVQSRPQATQQTSRGTGPRAMGMVSRGNMGEQMMIGSLAKSIVNPWSNAACVPDGSNSMRCCTLRQPLTLTTGAAGTCCGVILNTDPSAWYVLDSGSANTTPTVSGNFSAALGYTAMSALGSKYRMVSAGIKASYMGTTNNDGGLILCGQVAEGNPASILNGASLANAALVCSNYQTQPVRSGATITWRPSTQEDIDLTHPFNGTTAVSSLAATPNPFIFLYVYSGVNNGATMLQVEIIANYEIMIDNQTLIVGGINAAPPPAMPGWYEKSINVANRTPQIRQGIAGAEQTETDWWDMGGKALTMFGPALAKLAMAL